MARFLIRAAKPPDLFHAALRRDTVHHSKGRTARKIWQMRLAKLGRVLYLPMQFARLPGFLHALLNIALNSVIWKFW